MGDYNDIAVNHCGATTVTNLALYFAKRGYTHLEVNNKDETFEAVHELVGNGPIFILAGLAESYFAQCGYNLNYSSVGDTSEYELAILNNRPCDILLIDGLFAWHWVIGVGWVEYSTNDYYFRVNNNWNGNANTYYRPESGSVWWSATSYWVAN